MERREGRGVHHMSSNRGPQQSRADPVLVRMSHDNKQMGKCEDWSRLLPKGGGGSPWLRGRLSESWVAQVGAPGPQDTGRWKEATFMPPRKKDHLTFCKGIWLQISWIWDVNGTWRSRLSAGRHAQSEPADVMGAGHLHASQCTCTHACVKTRGWGKNCKDFTFYQYILASGKRKEKKFLFYSKWTEREFPGSIV